MSEKTKLNKKQADFVSYFLGESRGNATDAARRAGYSEPNKQGPRLLQHPAVDAEITQAREAIRKQGLAVMEVRLQGLQDDYEALCEIERARAKELSDVPGGSTGRLVRTPKLVKVYQAGEARSFQDGDTCPKCDHGDGTPVLRDTEVTVIGTGERRVALLCRLCGEKWHESLEDEDLQPIRQTLLVSEYAVDTGLLDAKRKIEAAMAAELGERKQKVEHSAPGGGPLTIREVIVQMPPAAPGEEDDEFAPGSAARGGDSAEADPTDSAFPLED